MTTISDTDPGIKSLMANFLKISGDELVLGRAMKVDMVYNHRIELMWKLDFQSTCHVPGTSQLTERDKFCS